MILIIVITAVALLLTYLYISEKKKETYWSSKGVKDVKYKKVFGILWDYVVSEGTLAELYRKFYNEFPNELYIGGFLASKPVLIARDPKIVQHVLRTDYQSYLSRGANFNFDADKLADNVLFMDGNRWKLMRQKLTPVFTSGKIKNMFYILDKTGQEFEKFVEKKQKDGSEHTLMDMLCAFTASSIGASVFGIDTHSRDNFDTPLQIMAKQANTPGYLGNIKFMILSLFPKLFHLSKMKMFGQNEKFFIKLVKTILRSREQEGVKRHDFVDTLLEIQKDGTLSDPNTGYEMEPTDELMAAQAFFFFIAGVDPTAATIHSVLYELSKNKEILQILLEEVDDVFEKNGKVLTYESVDNMEYLDKVINEAMRMYPPIGNLQRKCIMDNVLPDGTKVEKDTMIAIPVYAIHYDPTYYPEPELFNPERFSPEVAKERPNYTFLPFGEGNRICIGMRYARIQIKSGLVHLLRKYSVQSDGAVKKPKFEKSFFNMRAMNFYYTFVLRQKK